MSVPEGYDPDPAILEEAEKAGFMGPPPRLVRDARLFTIGGGTAQILRTVVASKILDRRLPQTRDGYVKETQESNKKSARG